MFDREKLREIGEAYARLTNDSVKDASGGNITFNKSDEIITVSTFYRSLSLSIWSRDPECSLSQSHKIKPIDRPIGLVDFGINSNYLRENTTTGLFYRCDSDLSNYPFYLEFRSKIYTDRITPDHGLNSNLGFKALKKIRTQVLEKISANDMGHVRLSEPQFPKDMEKTFRRDFEELIKLIRKLKFDDLFNKYSTEDLLRILLMKREMDDRIADAHDRQIEEDGFKGMMMSYKQ